MVEAGQARLKISSHLDEEGVGDVVAQQLEALVVEEVLDVASGPSEKIVDAEHLAAAIQ